MAALSRNYQRAPLVRSRYMQKEVPYLLEHSSQGAIAAIAPIIATLGLLGLIRAVIGFIWGHADVQLEAPLSKVGYKFGDTTIVMSPMSLFVLLFVIRPWRNKPSQNWCSNSCLTK